jgi:hypothetical protein
MERCGHPHDAVARFARSLLEEPQGVPIPGGIPKEVQEFLKILSAAVDGSQFGVSIEVVARMIANVRAGEAGGDAYGLALFGTLMTEEGQGLRFKEFFEALVVAKTLPAIPVDVGEETAQGMEQLLRFIQQEDLWVELRNVGNAIAQSRLCGTPLDDIAIARVEQLRELEAPFGPFASWLTQLTTGSEKSPLPAGIPDHIAAYVETWRLNCIACCDRDAIAALVTAAVEKRLLKQEIPRAQIQILKSLENAGGLYKKLSTLIRKLSTPQSFPPIPLGMPLDLLSIVASARREALWRENAGVVVMR